MNYHTEFQSFDQRALGRLARHVLRNEHPASPVDALRLLRSAVGVYGAPRPLIDEVVSEHFRCC